MFYYKTSWCPTKKDSHDSKSCIYAHHMRDFRRPPDLFKYAPEDCDTLVNGVSWDTCPRGIKCNKCHTTVERALDTAPFYSSRAAHGRGGWGGSEYMVESPAA